MVTEDAVEVAINLICILSSVMYDKIMRLPVINKIIGRASENLQTLFIFRVPNKMPCNFIIFLK